jgi:hypothetical protein
LFYQKCPLSRGNYLKNTAGRQSRLVVAFLNLDVTILALRGKKANRMNMKFPSRSGTKITLGQQRALDRLEKKLRFDAAVKSRVKVLRMRYDIPENAYPELAKKTIQTAPDPWMMTADYETRKNRFDALCLEVNDLLNDLGFFQVAISPSALLNYIYSNELFQPGQDTRIPGIPNPFSSYCISSISFYDAKRDRQEYKTATDEEKQAIDEHANRLDKALPIAIRVHPQSSWKEIREDLKEAWAFIQLQHDYYLPDTSNPPYTRTKKDYTKERDQLIMEHLGKPNSDIRRALAHRFPGCSLPNDKQINSVRRRHAN